MYQVTRKNRIKETLQLCHADGTVALEVDVDLNVDIIGNRVNKAHEALAMAQLELQKTPSSTAKQEAYGKAVIALLNVIFGENGSRQIVEFYENNYTELLLDLFPFINNEIMPKVRAAVADRTAQLVAAAREVKKGNRAQRRRWRK